jgi:hypothetical protein
VDAIQQLNVKLQQLNIIGRKYSNSSADASFPPVVLSVRSRPYFDDVTCKKPRKHHTSVAVTVSIFVQVKTIPDILRATGLPADSQY